MRKAEDLEAKKIKSQAGMLGPKKQLKEVEMFSDSMNSKIEVVNIIPPYLDVARDKALTDVNIIPPYLDLARNKALDRGRTMIHPLQGSTTTKQGPPSRRKLPRTQERTTTKIAPLPSRTTHLPITVYSTGKRQYSDHLVCNFTL